MKHAVRMNIYGEYINYAFIYALSIDTGLIPWS